MMALKPMKPFYNLINICRKYSSTSEDPFSRTLKIISQDVRSFFGREREIEYPHHADVVIVGGGIMGSSVAYWLKSRAGRGLNVVVLEKDFTYKNSLKPLTLGRLNQHYSLPENTLLSLYAADFLRNIKDHFEDESVDLNFEPIGNLLLASEKYADRLDLNIAIQKELGVKNELLSPATIKHRYPWINLDDIKLGSISYDSEGYFDSWKLQNHFMKKAINLGAIYVNAEVIGFKRENQKDVLMEGVEQGTYSKMTNLVYKTHDNEEHEVKFAACVLAAGTSSCDIAKYLNIGYGNGMLSVPLPTEKKTYNIHTFKTNVNLGLNTPLVTDSNGLNFRKNGQEQNQIICNQTIYEKTKHDYDELNEFIKPALSNRVLSLDEIDLVDTRTEYCDSNKFDDTGIIGNHPYYNNLYFACGFGNLGYVHAPGIGRAITELIIDGQYMTIDLTRFGFDRFLTGESLVEYNVY